MEITDIQIIKVEGKGKLLAYANIVINDAIVMKGIKIIDGAKEKFIVMPSQTLIRKGKIKNFEYFHPINNEARNLISEAVINTYNDQNND